MDRYRPQFQYLIAFCREIYLLEVFGALSVSALGWAACQLSGTPWYPSAPLWFAGYLAVYNWDRLYLDPADSLNVPLRFRSYKRLRWKRVVMVNFGALILVIWPVFTGQSLLLPGLLALVVGFQFYSRPLPGSRIRWKDLPGVKSIFVPAFVATILVIWPILQAGKRLSWLDLIIFAWCYLVLGINSLVFDLRDITGDRLHSTPTIPVRLGGKRTNFLLVALGASMVLLSGCLGLPGDVSRTLALALACVHIAVMVAIQCRAKPIWLSFLADLLLLTPAFSIGLLR
ncbi:MAG TPA: UbiA family prenyltransferase [Chthoniobacterales bacterium]|nr:UbiA family prenyltransferase [Chthoniobacterales bacterium]